MDHDEKNAEALREIGIYGLKTIVLLNSGAIVAALSLVGTLGTNAAIAISISTFKIGVVFFLVGLSFAALTITSAFILAQNNFTRDGWTLGQRMFLSIQIVPALLSYAFFSLGVVSVICSVGQP